MGLSRTATGRPVPLARVRARGRLRLEDPVVGWAASIAVTLLALFLRLWHLGTPHEFEFDETYYAKDAWSLLHFGYAKDYVNNANDKILDGTTTGVWKEHPGDDRPPRGREVADRARGEDLRDGPVRLAHRLGRRRLADGAGDVPAGAAADRLDRARAASPGCC